MNIVVEYVERGRTAEDIAQELGVHRTTVVHALRRAGVEVRPPGRRTKLEVSEEGEVRVHAH